MIAYKGRPKRSIYLKFEFPESCVQIQTQMNPSSTSLHSKAAGLTKIFSPATLSILDMSPSIACTMDQCQTHFACGDFLYHEQHNSFLGNDAVHEENVKKGGVGKVGSKGIISETIMAYRIRVACELIIMQYIVCFTFNQAAETRSSYYTCPLKAISTHATPMQHPCKCFHSYVSWLDFSGL